MGNAAGGLPYDAGASIEYTGCSYWQLSAGSKKDEKEEKEQVTIFKCLKSQADKVTVAARNLQKLRTLKHPYILSFLDGAVMEEALLLVTESCVPLELWIQQKAFCDSSDDKCNTLLEVVWGFRCILSALQFLHSDRCALMHGYLGLHSIFVTKNGDWKLGSLDLACNLALEDDASFFNTYNHLLIRPFISPERLQSTNAVNALACCPGAADIFSLAHCIQITFDRLKLEIPDKNFDKYLQRMLALDVKKRPTAGQVAGCPIFNSEEIKLFISLNDLAIKPPSDSLEILGNLDSRVSMIPRAVCIHKILPSVSRALQMALNDFSARNSRESCRQSVDLSMKLLSTMASHDKLDESCYISRCLPVLEQLWSMNDRSIRTTLLKTLKSLIVLTPAIHINKSVFDPMLAGFADSNAKMREDTLKNLAHVVDKLDEKNLQEKLIRCIVNLQNDAESSIRTNATIFLGRTASRLKDGVRTRVICPAFAKAMRDPFVHCRLAGLKATIACVKVLDLQQLTSKIMPQACLLLLDRSSDVREKSLELLNDCSVLLRIYHQKTLNTDDLAAKATEQLGSGQNNSSSSRGGGGVGSNADAGGASGNASWTSWVSDSITKTIEKVATTANDDGSMEISKVSSSSCTEDAGPKVKSGSGTDTSAGAARKIESRTSSSSNVSLELEASFMGNSTPRAAEEGWGDDDWDVEEEERSSWGAVDGLGVLDIEEDEEVVGKNESTTEKLTASSTSSTAPSTSSKSRFENHSVLQVASATVHIGGLSLSKSAKTAKPVIKKLDTTHVDWDDF